MNNGRSIVRVERQYIAQGRRVVSQSVSQSVNKVHPRARASADAYLPDDHVIRGPGERENEREGGAGLTYATFFAALAEKGRVGNSRRQ